MKNILTIAILLITQISFGQVKTWKAQGDGTPAGIPESKVAQMIGDSLANVVVGSSIDMVSNSANLKNYSSDASYLILTDTLQGGLFLYTTDANTVDNGVVFPATGKGSGYWVRQYDKSKGVSVDWWGSRNASSIQNSMVKAGDNGIINFTPNKLYFSDQTIIPRIGQTLYGNGATLQRIPDSIVTITSVSLTTDNSITVSSIPSTWTAGKTLQLFTDSTAYSSTFPLTILSIVGNTVNFTTTIGSNVNINIAHPAVTSWGIGTSVRYIFTMVASLGYSPDSYKLYNLTFDGNRDYCRGNFYWAVNTAIIAVGTGAQVTIRDCRFINMPNENIMGHGLHVVDNYAANLNGSFVHLSANFSVVPSPTPSIISGNVTNNTNRNPDSVSVHSEGVITFSNTPGYSNISNNRFENGSEAVFGYITNVSALDYSNGGQRNTLIQNNFAKNFRKIFYNITAQMPTPQKGGHLFISGNTFDNCGLNDFGSQKLAIDTAFDTLMIAQNLLVGGTKWNIPIQKSDTLQRYILNNPSIYSQGADINITGNIKANTAILNYANTPNSVGNVLTIQSGGAVTQRAISQLTVDMNAVTSTAASVNYYGKWLTGNSLGVGATYEMGGTVFIGGNLSLTGPTNGEFPALIKGGLLSGNYRYTGLVIGQAQGTNTSGVFGYMTHQTVPTSSGIFLANYSDAEGTAGIFIKRGGNVGLNTINPTQKLQINGQVKIDTTLTGAITDSLLVQNAGVIKRVGRASGTATLIGGTVTVSTAILLSGSKIMVSVNTPSGTQGFLSVPSASRTAGTSFVINSSSATETSTVDWIIIN